MTTHTHPQPSAGQPAHPLATRGAVEAVVHLCGGKQIREVLPEVKAELVSIERDAVEDLISKMEDGE